MKVVLVSCLASAPILVGCASLLGADFDHASIESDAAPASDGAVEAGSPVDGGDAGIDVALEAGVQIVAAVVRKYCPLVYGINAGYGATGCGKSCTAGAYDYVCYDDTGATHPVDFQDLCRTQTNDIDAWADFDDPSDGHSWHCYIPLASLASLAPAADGGSINADEECRAQYDPSSSYVYYTGVAATNVLRCRLGDGGTGPLDFQDACTRQYGSPFAVARAASDYEHTSWRCYDPGTSSAPRAVGGVDLLGYCRHLFGPNATSFTTDPDSYGIRCGIGTVGLPIDMQDACRRAAGDRRAFARFAAVNDPRSWSCYLPQ